MSGAGRWAVLGWLALAGVATAVRAQVAEGFNWVDLKTDSAKVAAVAKALEGEKYTALREIGVAGDAALVVTARRDNPTSRPELDHYTVYSVNLTDGSASPLLNGSRLRLLDWERFLRDGQPELVATYDDCTQCTATTFLTAFYLDPKTKQWEARWKREKAGAPLAAADPGGASGDDHVYALMVGVDGRAVLGTWQHFSGPARRSGDDYVFEYAVDLATGEDRVRPLAGSEAQEMKLRLCKADDKVLDLASGQDSASCKAPLAAAARHTRHGRRRAVRRGQYVNMTGQSDPAHPHR